MSGFALIIDLSQMVGHLAGGLFIFCAERNPDTSQCKWKHELDSIITWHVRIDVWSADYTVLISDWLKWGINSSTIMNGSGKATMLEIVSTYNGITNELGSDERMEGMR